MPSPDAPLVAIQEDSGLALIDPAVGSVAPHASEFSLAESLLDSQRNQLWVAPSDEARIGFVSIGDGATKEIRIDAPLIRAVLLEDAGVMALLHDDPMGHVSFVNVTNPTREASWSVQGFLFEGILD